MAGLIKTPKIQPATRLPDRDDPKLQAERKRKTDEMRQRGGRDSTILSSAVGGKLGAR